MESWCLPLALPCSSYTTPVSTKQGVKREARTSLCSALQSSRESRQALAVLPGGEPTAEAPVPTPPGLGEENTRLPRIQELCLGHCYFLVAAEMFSSGCLAKSETSPEGELALYRGSPSTELSWEQPRETIEPDLSPRDDFLCSVFWFFTVWHGDFFGVIRFNAYFFFFAR